VSNLRQMELITVSGLFDPGWYRTFYSDVPDSGLSPVSHYLRIGGKENRHPSPLFDALFYLSKYPEVSVAGINPLVHYLQFGLAEGRQIRSLKRNSECELISRSGFFSKDWYLSRYPDVAVPGLDPIEHFLDFATLELRDPGPFFSTEYYLSRNPGAAASTSNPVVHYVTEGLGQKLIIRGVDWQRQRTILRKSGFFDPDWYLRTYLDVARTGADPLDHYLDIGDKEGRCPSPYFNAKQYLLDNPDVAEHGINSLLHYLQSGAAEGRRRRDLPAAIEGVGAGVDHSRGTKRTLELLKNGSSQRNGADGEHEAKGGMAKLLVNRARAFAGHLIRFTNESKTQKDSAQRAKNLAIVSESDSVRISQDFAVLQNTDATLLAEVARLKNQVEAARGKLQSVWDFVFRLQSEHVAASAELKAELAALHRQVPELQAALVDSRRENNALRLQNTDWKQTGDRMSSALAKTKAETIQVARERDEARLQIARRLSSKAWLFKRVLRF
jgi:regulator of replication initiation timing